MTPVGALLALSGRRGVLPSGTRREYHGEPSVLKNRGFVRDVSRIVKPSRESENGARCRVRTCNTTAENQAFTNERTPEGTPPIKSLADLAEIVAAWPHLSAELRRAIGAMVSSVVEGKGAAR